MPTYKDWIQCIDIDIDYYSAFIKAWIAFNSWYRSEYLLRTDREIIEKIKTQSNQFRTHIESFLNLDNQSMDAQDFRSNILLLQSALTNAAIMTQERGGVSKQISFSDIAIVNPKNLAEGDYRQTHYKVFRTSTKVTTIVHKKSDPSCVFFSFEQDTYQEQELDAHADFNRLGTEQKGQCKAFYRDVNPYATESIMTTKDKKVVFVDDKSKVSRGIVETLYLLRCSLMHGEVYPSKTAVEVYKYAYYVLSAVLKKLI